MGENWNLDHIRAQAANWTLQGDADLLEALVKISKDVVEKAEASSRKVDDLCISLDRANCDLQNTTNSFTALANQQFMENRVAEEEPVIAAEQRKIEPEISAAERNKKVRDEVLRNSLAFLDENFDFIEVPKANESDDEQLNSKPAFQVKNPTLGIKIPFVIGSKEFEEDDYIGLRPAAVADSKEPTMPVEVNWGSSSFDPSISSEEDARSASVGTQQSNQSSQKSSFINELAATVGGESPSEAEVQVTQPKFRSLMSAYDQREPPPLFGGQEDEEEGNDTIFGSGANLFKSDKIAGKSKLDEERGNLFADEDDNLFDEAPQPKQTSSENSASKPPLKLPAGAVSIFGNNKPMLPKQRPPSTSSKGSFDEPVQPAQSPVVSKLASPLAPTKPNIGLFDDDSDEDLFAAPPVVKETPSKVVLGNNSSKSSLFGDSMEDDDFIKPPTNSIADKPPAINSSTNVIGATKPVPKKLSLFGDSDSDEDIFSASNPSSSSKGLFGDETEDLFKPAKKPESALEDIFSQPKTIAPVEEKIVTPKPEEVQKSIVKPKIEEKPAPKIVSTDTTEIKKRLNLVLTKETPKVVNLFESPETEEKKRLEKPEKVLTNQLEDTEKAASHQESKSAPPQSAVRRGLSLKINPLALLPGSKPLKTPTPLSPETPSPSALKETPPLSPPAEEISSPLVEHTPATEEETPGESASFDNVPVSSSQLLHPGKDRIKIKQKRKPPTRKGRQASVESPSDPSTSNPVSPATDEDDLFIVPDVPPAMPAEEKSPPPVVKEVPRFGELEVSPSSIFMEPPPLPSKIDDLFGDEDDFLFNDPVPANEPKVDARLSFEPPPLPNEKLDTPSDDLFASSVAKSPVDLFFAPVAMAPPDLPKASISNQESLKVTDIFEKDDLFGPPKPSAIETPKAIFNSEPPPLETSDDIFGDDDLFSDALSPNSSSDLFFETHQSKEEQAISSPDKAEVFLTPDSSLEFNKAVENLGPEKNITDDEPASLFDEDEDDDDLFGAPIKSISTPKPEHNQKVVKEKSASPPTQVKNQVHDLFAEDDDDDDDLFGSVHKTVPKQAEKIQKAEPASASKEPSKDLFEDSSKQDIIKQKKELVKKKSSALFGDLDDEENDLFGSSVASKAPPKQQAQPKGQEKKKSDDLFDDPLLGGM
ncbi:WASH complex subunit 2 [Cloeon dipterum]|uniref:WASH complex subunit 2 n=1 Tax=Cloeon dipterum TaxID=197152 RepID=UPI00321FA6D1